VEEETKDLWGKRVRWRGRKLWILLFAVCLAALLVLLLVWVNPSSDFSDNGVAQAEEIIEVPGGENIPAEQPQNQDDGSQDVESGDEVTINPGGQGNAPDMVVNFPDPAGETTENPPPGGYQNVYGHWVLEMYGAQYGLANCHINVNEDGTISAPPDYVQVFEISFSEYAWAEGDPSFSASLQLVVKLGSSQTLVPVKVELTGSVSDSFEEITGEFTAEPVNESYAPYSQRGEFGMHR
jgi:hypothetical protein